MSICCGVSAWQCVSQRPLMLETLGKASTKRQIMNKPRKQRLDTKREALDAVLSISKLLMADSKGRNTTQKLSDAPLNKSRRL